MLHLVILIPYYLTGALVLQRDFLPAELLQLSEKTLAMRAIGGVVVALLIRDQGQGGRQIQHGLGQGNLQEQADLSDAQRQRGIRVQAGHLSGCGQRTGGRRVQGPPLSGSGVVANEPGNDGRERPWSCGGAIRAKNAVRSGPFPVLPCLRQNRSRWANASRSPAQRWQAASPAEHYSGKTSILAPLLIR